MNESDKMRNKLSAIGNTRRQPIILVVNVSHQMRGDNAAIAMAAIAELAETWNSDPLAMETFWITVVTWGADVCDALPLQGLPFEMPNIETESHEQPMVSDERLIEHVSMLIKREMRTTTATKKGDWKPIIIIITHAESAPSMPFIKDKHYNEVCIVVGRGNDMIAKMEGGTIIHLPNLKGMHEKLAPIHATFRFASCYIPPTLREPINEHIITDDIPSPPQNLQLLDAISEVECKLPITNMQLLDNDGTLRSQHEQNGMNNILPIYIVINNSDAMCGEKGAIGYKVLETLILKAKKRSTSTVKMSIILWGSRLRQILPLTDIDSVLIPEMNYDEHDAQELPSEEMVNIVNQIISRRGELPVSSSMEYLKPIVVIISHDAAIGKDCIKLQAQAITCIIVSGKIDASADSGSVNMRYITDITEAQKDMLLEYCGIFLLPPLPVAICYIIP